jgi:hypothetical protein
MEETGVPGKIGNITLIVGNNLLQQLLALPQLKYD